MSHETQAVQSPSRLKFWLLRLVKFVGGAFLTSVLIGFATMFLRDMGLLDSYGQQTSFTLLSVASWIAWLVYLVAPLFRRRRPGVSA